MTFEERTAALAFLRLTPRQTRFVAFVALHGGYFLGRQYAAFAGITQGKAVRGFLGRLVERGIASRASYERNCGAVYRLRTRAIYKAIDIDHEAGPDGSGRSPALVARRIILLDFAIGTPDVRWCVTEQDKVTLFLTEYQVPVTRLPRRVRLSPNVHVAPAKRHFAHTEPIYVAGDPPVVHFVFSVHQGAPPSFRQFLLDRARLLSSLPAWAVVAVCPERRPGLTACEKTFARFMAGSLRPVGPKRPRELRWYFEMRRAVDRRDQSVLAVDRVERFLRARSQFGGEEFDRLYAGWLSEGDVVLDRMRAQEMAPPPASAGRLITHALPFRYRQFGALPGVA
jgi:hypothetical protein